MKVVLRPAAAADIEDAYRWYRKRDTSFGDDFLKEVDNAVTRITEHPKAYRVLYRDTRRVRLERFPYGLFYRAYDDQIVVVACMHARRDPRRWKSRV